MMIKNLKDLIKALKEDLEPSSLQVISFYELRKKYEIPIRISDSDIMMACKALNFDFFGESGIWVKRKINRK